MARKYVPSGGFTLGGVLLGTAALIVAGAAVGGIVHLVGRAFYLILLFPILMGLAGSFVLQAAIVRGKIRNMAIAVLMGVAGAIAIYGSMHFFDYLQFRGEATAAMAAERGGGDQPVRGQGGEPPLGDEELLDLFLMNEVGDTGFVGYVKFAAKQGVSIGRVGSGGSGGNLGQTGTYIYWLVELAAILIIVALGAGAARKPFCEQCGTWYAEQALAATSGASVAGLRAAIDGSDFRAVGAALERAAGRPYAVLKASRCPKCEKSEPLLRIDEVHADGRGKETTKRVYESLVPLEGLRAVEEAAALHAAAIAAADAAEDAGLAGGGAPPAAPGDDAAGGPGRKA